MLILCFMCEGIVLVVNKVDKTLSYKNSGTHNIANEDFLKVIVYKKTIKSKIVTLQKFKQSAEKKKKAMISFYF